MTTFKKIKDQIHKLDEVFIEDVERLEKLFVLYSQILLPYDSKLTWEENNEQWEKLKYEIEQLQKGLKDE